MSALCRIFSASLFCLTAFAQTSEVTTKESPVTFKSTSNLVPVTVVVRDSKGKAIGTLGRDDFQLFDNGKPQVISKFTVENLAPGATEAPTSKRLPTNSPESHERQTSDGIPNRFVAYLFDDIHLEPSDLIYTRDAAKRQIDASLHEFDRVAIYTTSGARMQDFTNDRDKLHATLAAIQPQGAAARAMEQATCPPVSYYMGDLISNHDNADALAIAINDAQACAKDLTAAMYLQMASTSAREAVAMGDRNTQWALDATSTVIGKMSSMPGQRSIVLISPGFLVLSDRQYFEAALIEKAMKANVVIGALDARGLYVNIPGGGAGDKQNNPGTISAKYRYASAAGIEQAGIMDDLAAGTGGTFYKGTNDFDDGLSRTASAPDYLYVLGFTPQEFKFDGSFHSLKVTLRNVKGMSLQTRKGYYAPKHSADQKEISKQQLEDAFFSRDEIHDLPATLQTKFFKLDNGEATLSAVSTIDVKKLPFHKDADRNLNEVTVQTGLFDDDGNFVSGVEKVITLRLLNETLETRLAGGISVKNSFTVHPGRYVVRMVVRDTEGQLMSAQSSVVEIP